MIREDFLMRMIEQIGVLVSRVLKQDISQETLDEELDAITGKWIGLPSSLLLSLPPEEAFLMIEDSNRMVVEKSYLMGEMFYLKGRKSDSPSERKAFFAKALYFYGKCSGKVGESLQGTIDEKIEELGREGAYEAYSEPEDESEYSRQSTDLCESTSRVKQSRRRFGGVPKSVWSVIAACVVGMVVFSFSNEDEIEIIDQVVGFENGLAQLEYTIVNNTDEMLLIRLRYTVGHTSSDTFGSTNTFLGSVEREHTVPAHSTKKVVEEFEYLSKTPRAGQEVTVAVLSHEAVEVGPTP